MPPFANWPVLAADFLIVLNLALGGVVFSAVLQLSGARWHYEVRRVALALTGLLPLAFVLLMVLLASGEGAFPWLGKHEHESAWSTYTFALVGQPVAVALPQWHNYTFLVARETAAFLAVAFIFARYIKLLTINGQNQENLPRFRRVSYWVPPIFVLYGTLVAWDFEMTLVPEWHSAIYGMHHFISNFGMFISFMMVVVYFCCKNQLMVKRVPAHVYNYISQIMLAFTLLWAYTFFSQYLTIWYGNLPHERNRIAEMEGGDFSTLWWTVIALKFAIPFVLLIFDFVRHTPGMIAAIACSIFVGTWLERYIWIAGSYPPGPYEPAHMPMTGAYDIAVTAAVILASYFLTKRTMLRNGVIYPRGASVRA